MTTGCVFAECARGVCEAPREWSITEGWSRCCEQVKHPDELKTKLSRFRRTYGGTIVDNWLRLIDEERSVFLVGSALRCRGRASAHDCHVCARWFDLVERLLSEHYDGSYSFKEAWGHKEAGLEGASAVIHLQDHSQLQLDAFEAAAVAAVTIPRSSLGCNLPL